LKSINYVNLVRTLKFVMKQIFFTEILTSFGSESFKFFFCIHKLNCDWV